MSSASNVVDVTPLCLLHWNRLSVLYKHIRFLTAYSRLTARPRHLSKRTNTVAGIQCTQISSSVFYTTISCGCCATVSAFVHHIFAHHPRHVLGIFPDAHTSFAEHDGLELLRLNPMPRQDTATGRSQLVHLRLVEQILSDSSSSVMTHHPRNFACVPHRLSRTAVGGAGLKFLLWSNLFIHCPGYVFYPRQIRTITQLSPFRHWLIPMSRICHEMRRSVKFFSFSLSFTSVSFFVLISVRMFTFLTSECSVVKWSTS